MPSFRILSDTTLTGGGSDSSGIPSGAGAPPTNVTGLTCSGFMDPISGVVTLTVGVTPPSPLGTFEGCHLYLEVPDQSGNPAQVVGSTAVGGTAAVTGPWRPYDLGQQPYSASQQPWTIVFPGVPDLDFTRDIPARLYAASYSNVWDLQLVQANQSGGTPSTTFTLASLASGTPTAGTSVTATSGPIVATVQANDNTTGKLKTPVEVLVTTVPANIKGWCYQLVMTPASADPTVAANQSVVTPLYSQAGLVPSTSDGIAAMHTFVLDTPTTMVSATVWLQSGLVDSTGNFNGNPIVPGVTPCWPITYGSTTGTVDARQVLIDSIAASMAVTSGLFGVANGGIATINLQALAVTNPILAALAVQAANLANSSVTATAIANAAVGTAAIATAAITNALIANLAVDAAKIVSATITNAQIANATIAGANIASATIGQGNMANASIGTAQIQNASIVDAHVSNLNVSKLTAGTANFSGTASFQSGSGGRLTLSGSGVGLLNGNWGMNIDSNGTITQSNFWGVITTIGDLSGVGGIGQGLKTATVMASNLNLTLGSIDFPAGQSATSATAGSASALPSSPDGYVKISVNGVTKKIPYYAN